MGSVEGTAAMLVALLDDPWLALLFLIFVVVYQHHDFLVLARHAIVDAD